MKELSVLVYTIVFICCSSALFAQSPILAWTEHYYSPASGSYEWSFVESDSQGNVIVVGRFEDQMNMNPDGTTDLLGEPDSGGNCFVRKMNAEGDLLWQLSINCEPASSTGEIVPKDFVIDGEDNIIIAGQFVGVCDFNPGSGQHIDTAYYPTAFVLKIDMAGNFIWAGSLNIYPSTDNSSISNFFSLDVDDQENIYLGGSTKGIVDFDPTSSVQLDTTSMYFIYHIQEGFLLKLNHLGQYQWKKSYRNERHSHISDVHCVNNNSLAFAGVFADSIAIQDNFIDTSFQIYSLGGEYCGLIGLMDFEGQTSWVNFIEGSQIRTGDLEFNSDKIFLSGSFENAMNPLPHLPWTWTYSHGEYIGIPNQDAFILSYSLDGTIHDNMKLGGQYSDDMGSLEFDQLNNLYLSVSTFDTLFINDELIDPPYGNGGSNARLVKFNPTLEMMNIIRVEKGFMEYSDYTFNSDQSFFITGEFSDSTDFDPDVNNEFIMIGDGSNIYVSRWDDFAFKQLKELEFILYPNPTSDILHIHYQGNDSDYVFNMYTLSGQKTISFSGSEPEFSVDLTELASGVYIVEFISEMNVLKDKIRLIK